MTRITSQRHQPFSLSIPLAIVLVFTGCSEEPIEPALRGSYAYGPIDGFVQTPSGGNPGTTSPRRPTLHEIGIRNANVVDAELEVSRQNHQVYAGGQLVDLSGSEHLGRTLVTHDVTFPAGTGVHSDVSLDWYRLGYRYRYVLSSGAGPDPERDPVWTLFPSIGGALSTFDYKLRGGGQSTSRSYSKGLPQLGLELEWRPRGGPLSFSASGLGFPPVTDSIPTVALEELQARYRFLQSEKLDVDGFVGVRFEQFEFKDNQQVPNHVDADLGPMGLIGLSFRF